MTIGAWLAALSEPRTGPEVTDADPAPPAGALVVDALVVLVADAVLVTGALCEAEALLASEVLWLELLPHADTPADSAITAVTARLDCASRLLIGQSIVRLRLEIGRPLPKDRGSSLAPMPIGG